MMRIHVRHNDIMLLLVSLFVLLGPLLDAGPRMERRSFGLLSLDLLQNLLQIKAQVKLPISGCQNRRKLEIELLDRRHNAEFGDSLQHIFHIFTDSVNHLSIILLVTNKLSTC